MSSAEYGADVVVGEISSDGMSSPAYRSSGGFWGALRDPAVNLDVPPAHPPLAEFEGIRLLRQPNRIGVSFVLRTPGPCTLAVYDVTGRVIRRDDRTAPIGVFTLWWDGQDEGGRAVSSGMYFVRVAWNGRSASARALWLR